MNLSEGELETPLRGGETLEGQVAGGRGHLGAKECLSEAFWGSRRQAKAVASCRNCFRGWDCVGDVIASLLK